MKTARNPVRSVFISVVVMLMMVSAITFADTHYMSKTGNGLGATNWATAVNNLISAQLYASNGDTILVDDGTYDAFSYSGVGGMEVTRSVTIISVNGPGRTIFKGNGTQQCFNVSAANVVFDGFTITNGLSAIKGGVNLSLRNCIITKCPLNYGYFDTERASIDLMQGGLIDRCVIQNNDGGIFCSDSIIQNSSIFQNHSSGTGGGINASGSTIRNCSIVGNYSAANYGGGLFLYNSTVVNSIVWGNTTAGTSTNMDNYINWTSTPNCFKYSCTTPLPEGSGNISADPKLRSGDWHLSINSPCIDAGTNDIWMIGQTDIDGETRITNSKVDIGADEFVLVFPSIPINISASSGIYTNKISVTWQQSTHATGYEIWRSTTNNSSMATLAGTSSTVTYNDISMTLGILYYYWVKATNSDCSSSLSDSCSGYASVPQVLYDYNYVTNNGAIRIISYTGSGGAITIPGMINGLSVTSIESNAFKNCTSLSSIGIPDTVDSIGIGAFQYCNNLLSITLPIKVTNISDKTFWGCTSLTSISIGSNVISIGVSAFYTCQRLKSVTIPNNVISIGDTAFEYCTGLTNVTIGTGVTSIGSGAFGDCSGLTRITIPNNVKDIQGGAFIRSRLTGIVIPNSITSIEGSVFMQCYDLSSVTIPNSITNIGRYAFYQCNNLHSLNIPDSVTTIGDNSFNGCTRLTSVYFKGNAPLLGSSVFLNDSSATIYYYPWTEGWGSTYGGRTTKVNPSFTAWRTTYGYPSSGTSDSLDTDVDGMLNWQEFLANTNPTNKADNLAVMTFDSGVTNIISWLAKSQVTYQILKSSNLVIWDNSPSGTGQNGQSQQKASNNQTLQYIDPTTTMTTSTFYRVIIIP